MSDIEKEFNVYGKTLHNVLNCSNTAADYIDHLEARINQLEKANKVLMALVKDLREWSIDQWETNSSETDWQDVDRYYELIDKSEEILGGGESE